MCVPMDFLRLVVVDSEWVETAEGHAWTQQFRQLTMDKYGNILAATPAQGETSAAPQVTRPKSDEAPTPVGAAPFVATGNLVPSAPLKEGGLYTVLAGRLTPAEITVGGGGGAPEPWWHEWTDPVVGGTWRAGRKDADGRSGGQDK